MKRDFFGSALEYEGGSDSRPDPEGAQKTGWTGKRREGCRGGAVVPIDGGGQWVTPALASFPL